MEMEEKRGISSTSPDSSGPEKPFWRTPLGRWEMWSRVWVPLGLMIAMPALAAALGINNMGVTLPETVGNTSQTIPLLNGPYLQRSINIFAGIFIPLSVLTLLYQISWIVFRCMNLDCMNNNNYALAKLDMVLMSFGFAVCVGGLVGCFYLGSLLSSYSQLYTVEGDSIDQTIRMLSAVMWAGFGGFVGSFGNFYSTNIQLAMLLMAYMYIRRGKCNNPSCNKSYGAPNQQ